MNRKNFSMEQRKDKRIIKNLVVSFGDMGFESLGITSNISSQGMCIRSNQIFSPRQKLLLNLGIYNDIFEMQGMVVWSKLLKSKHRQETPAGIGIKITRASEKYQNYVDYFSRQRHLKSLS